MRAPLVEQLAQRPPLDALHDVERAASGRRAQAVDGHPAGMIDRGGELRLLPKALDRGRVGQQLLAQQLDRETLPGLGIDRAEDLPHGAVAERLAGQDGAADLERFSGRLAHAVAPASPTETLRPESRAIRARSTSIPNPGPGGGAGGRPPRPKRSIGRLGSSSSRSVPKHPSA